MAASRRASLVRVLDPLPGRGARLTDKGVVALLALAAFAVPLEFRAVPGGAGWRSVAAQLPVDVEVGGSREVLSGDEDPWEDYWIRATYRPGGGTFVYGTFRYTRRFGEEDHRYEAGAGTPLGERSSIRVDGLWSPTHRVAPRWGAYGSVSHSPAAGWTVSAGGGHEAWENATVNRQHAGVDRRFSRFALGYRAGFHQVDPGGSGVRHRVSGSLFYGEPTSTVTLGLAAGRDAVPVDVGVIRSTSVRSATLSGTHRLDGGLALTYAFAVHRHSPFFTRTSTSIGVRRQL